MLSLGSAMLRSRRVLVTACLVVLVLSFGSTLLIRTRGADEDGTLLPWSDHISGQWSQLTDIAAGTLGGWRSGGEEGGGVAPEWQRDVARWKGVMERQERQFGKRVLQKSVTHGGTGLRLHRALRKLARGEPMVISALGGSVTAGSNMPVESDKVQWIGRFFTLINETFPHPDHVFTIGAIGGLGSNYFQYCGAEHMAEAPDLVFVEHSVNDDVGIVQQASYESEVRAILQAPQRPAVIGIEVMSLMVWGRPLVTAGAQQLDVCRFYDLPFISLRDALLPELIAHPARVPLFYGRDGGGVNAGHVGTRGHWALGNMVAHYFLSELVSMAREGTLDVAPEELEESSDLDRDILDAERSIMKYDKDEQLEWRKTDLEEGVLEMQWGNELVHHDVPRTGITDPFDFHTTRRSLSPRCYALNGTREKLEFQTVAMGKALDTSGNELSEDGAGWIEWFSEQSWRAKYYVMTKSRHAVVRFDLQIEGEGSVGITFLRSDTLNLGRAKCWVDEDLDSAVELNGWWNNPHNLGDTKILRQGIEHGRHSLYCELIQGNEFRIIAIVTK